MAVKTNGASTKPRPSVRVGKTLLILDAFAWIIAVFLAKLFRYEFNMTNVNWNAFVGFALATVGLQFLFGLFLDLYSKGLRHPFGSFENALNVSIPVAGVGVVLWVVSLVFGETWGVSRGIMLIAAPLALVMILGIRCTTSMKVESLQRLAVDSTPSLVLGGRDIGTSLIQWRVLDSKFRFRQVGVVDDF